MRRRNRRILLYSLVMGVFLGFLVSGAWRPSSRYEPVPRTGGSLSSPATEEEQEQAQVVNMPTRKPYFFLPLPWRVQEQIPVLEAPPPATEEDMGEIISEARNRDLTLREQFAVLRIAYTRLNAQERGKLLRFFREGATMEEALDAYGLLRERLTKEELILTLSLVKRYRDDLQKLIRE